MRRSAQGYTVFLLALLLIACQSERSYQQGAHIRYFPEANSYFDEDNKVYLLFDTVEQQWGTRAQLNQEELSKLGNSVVVEKPALPVYRDNAQHRLMYATTRYTDRAELARKRREDSLASLPPGAKPLAPPPPTPEPPKKKTKVGRWLQKVFGKKDRDTTQ
ncbi:MAG: hypothetical protein EOO15_05520 [Chitinophagaceae bacterium]|nr:MAG: hypothetical protein EOO15_05520 [Chitinophagaceae bacterium]